MKKTVIKMPQNVARQPDPAEAWVQSRQKDATVTPLVQPPSR